MTTFAETLGMTIQVDENGPVTRLPIPESYLNGYGCAFGGCQILAANATAQQTLGPGPVGSVYSFRYLSKVLKDETMEGRTHIIKKGHTSDSTITEIHAGGRLVCTMYADFFHPGPERPFDVDPATAPISQPLCNLVLNSPEHIHENTPGQTIQTLFIGPVKWGLVEKLGLSGSVCAGVYTDNYFADLNGDVDPAFVGMLVDDAFGTACITLVGPVATTSLTLNLMRRIQPGAFLACDVHITLKTGNLLYATGSIFADGVMVGACSGTYYRGEDIDMKFRETAG